MNFETVAAAEKEVLDRELLALNSHEFDIVGVSQGGVIGERLAALYGERARTLVTASTPGFTRRNLADFGKAFAIDEAKLDRAIREEGLYNFTEQDAFYNRFYGDFSKILKLPPEMFSSERIPTIFKYGVLLSGKVMTGVAYELSPKTTWVDVLGTKDRITGYQQHLNAVRSRNSSVKKGDPSNSSIHLLGDASHTYANPQPTTLAEDISKLLQVHSR